MGSYVHKFDKSTIVWWLFRLYMCQLSPAKLKSKYFLQNCGCLLLLNRSSNIIADPCYHYPYWSYYHFWIIICIKQFPNPWFCVWIFKATFKMYSWCLEDHQSNGCTCSWPIGVWPCKSWLHEFCLDFFPFIAKFFLWTIKLTRCVITMFTQFDEQKDQVAVEQILRVVFLDPEHPSPVSIIKYFLYVAFFLQWVFIYLLHPCLTFKMYHYHSIICGVCLCQGTW